VRWCPDGEFLANFCVLYFQRAACSTFQTCILNSHACHIMCGSMVDIQSATADLRRGIKKDRRRRNHKDENIMAASTTQGGHSNQRAGVRSRPTAETVNVVDLWCTCIHAGSFTLHGLFTTCNPCIHVRMQPLTPLFNRTNNAVVKVLLSLLCQTFVKVVDIATVENKNASGDEITNVNF